MLDVNVRLPRGGQPKESLDRGLARGFGRENPSTRATLLESVERISLQGLVQAGLGAWKESLCADPQDHHPKNLRFAI